MDRNVQKNYSTSQINNSYDLYSNSDKTLLARYNIVLKDTVGKGSYSKVKEAYDLNHSRRIAVKIIDFSTAPQDFREKFLPREIEIWPKVSHPNIITMYQFILRPEKVYMVLEYAHGGDMLTHIQKRGPITEKDSKPWMKQICSAVEFLHKKEISHRDLKLENILIDSENNVKLSDFGFSKDLSLLEELSQTYCGSKAYASPEILLGQPYDPKKADVWAVGVILFIFLTGKMPFKEDECNFYILNQHRLLKIFMFKHFRLSYIVKNLIKWIFTFEWNKRPNICDVIKNEWFHVTLPDTNHYNLRSKKRKNELN